MGRPRRTPKNQSEERELERLRENQKNCRQRKLDQVDANKQIIHDLDQSIHDKFYKFGESQNQLFRLKNDIRSNFLNSVDKQRVEEIYNRMDSIAVDIERIKANYTQNRDAVDYKQEPTN